MSAKQIKADLIYGSDEQDILSFWQLPADAASYEQIVRQMAKALWIISGSRAFLLPSYKNDARAALRAIGITNPAKKGRK
jgi:hypothetical protein